MPMKAVYRTVGGRILAQSKAGVSTEYLLDPLGSVIGTSTSAGVVSRPPRVGPPRGGHPLVQVIIIAVGDLIHWSCTGETGLFTGIGDALGDAIHPDNVDLPVEPVTIRDADECSEEELGRRQREVERLCKKNGDQIRYDCYKLRKDPKKYKNCLTNLNACIAARESVCDCYFGGCNEGHQYIIDGLKNQR
jgi:hypothetical protein